jgi:hypothetical protein
VEKYGDLITNGLDLISFLLVTPELTRFARPLATWANMVLLSIIALVATEIVLVFMLFCGLVVLGLLGGSWSGMKAFLQDYVSNLSNLNIISGLVWGFLVFLGLLFRNGNPWLRVFISIFNESVSHHLFALGFALFLISRLIAFYGSALKAGMLG